MPPHARKRPCVLLTGFDAFGGAGLNASWQVVQAFQGRQVAGHRVVVAQLPTAFGASLKALTDLAAKHRPELVICVGQAGGRACISLERVAINVDDAPLCDNRGAQPIDAPVVPGGPAAYFSTLPIKTALRALQQAGVPAEVSQTAGTFVCNHVFYGLMHLLATQPALRSVRGGFVHLPWLPQQGVPSLAPEDQVRGLRLIVQAALGPGGPEPAFHGGGTPH